MTYAFRCPQVGLVEFFDSPGRHKCPFCNSSHATYEAGAPPKEEGLPNVIGDKLGKHYDWAAECEITSKSQRRRVYEEKGLRLKSYAEHRRQHGGLQPFGKGYSYAGQKNHKSTDEIAVRTKTGQRVV